MNAEMVHLWNERVQPEDTVFHLGDFAMGKKDLTLPFGKQLNGHKVLIIGNHDPKAARMISDAGFEAVHQELTIEESGFKFRLRHYPMGGHDGDKEEGPGDFDYLFCGHIHDLWVNRGSEINVGVDVRGFTPRTFEELIEGIPPKDFPPLTREKHHGKERA